MSPQQIKQITSLLAQALNTLSCRRNKKEIELIEQAIKLLKENPQ